MVPATAVGPAGTPVKVGEAIGAAPSEVKAAAAVIAPVPPLVTATGTVSATEPAPVIGLGLKVMPVPAVIDVTVPPVANVVGTQAVPLHSKTCPLVGAAALIGCVCSPVTVTAIAVVPVPVASCDKVIAALVVRYPCALTKAVVAMLVELSAVAGVGEVGTPVNAGEISGAAPRLVNAAAAVIAPVPPLVIATGTVKATEPVAVIVAGVRVMPAPAVIEVTVPLPIPIVAGAQAVPVYCRT